MQRPHRRSVLIGLGAGAGVLAIAALARPGREERAEAAQDAPAATTGVRPDLYHCDGCEAVSERDRAALMPVVRLAGPDEPGERMILSGRATLPGSGAPAPGVIVYAHHTNAAGLYANGTPETLWGRRHGRLRGWALTGADGQYRFETIKPAPYPDRSMPAHVHLFIGEPGRQPYYIDDAVFDGEFRVDADYRAHAERRGGDGVVRLQRSPDGIWLARRDILLERHA